MAVSTNLSAPAVTAPGGATGPAASTPATGRAAAQLGARSSVVLAYIGLALLVLAPGLALKLGLDGAGTPVLGEALSGLNRILSDITFGSGVRFWLGVSGATMMGLLLLYPIRKALAKRRGIGSVGGWFHLHILIGLFGPVAILYHCNFGQGGSNAKVALWSMLTVAGSGIAGFFVYGRASRDFYATAGLARRHRDAILAALPAQGDYLPWKDKLVGELEAFEAELLTPRQGLAACLRARLKVERYRRGLAHDIAWFVEESARRQAIGAQAHRQLRGVVGNHMRAYFALARAAASQSLREQVWARWRLFHLPVFLVMVVAVVLHIIAVWGMDKPAPAGERAALEAGAPPTAVAAKPPQSIEAVLSRSEAVPGETEAATGEGTPAPRDRPTGIAVRSVTPRIVAVQPPTPEIPAAPKTATAETARPRAEPPTPLIKPAPVQVARAAEAPSSPAAEPAAPAKPAVRPPAPTPPVSHPAAAAPPVPAAKPVAAPAPSQPPAIVATAPSAPAQSESMNQVYSELQRRTESEPPMALGGAKPRTLAEQIATLKERRAAGVFLHSEAETGFALVGRHLKVECASCHTKRLQEEPQSTRRQCIDCHKKDDNHNGRRPNCGECHNPNRFSQVKRGK